MDNIMMGKTEDSEPVVVLLDHDGMPITIDWAHYMIHKGMTFRCCYIFPAIANNAVATFYIQPNGEELHLTGAVASNGEAEVSIFRSPTSATGGTAMTPVNMNDKYSDESVVQLTREVTRTGGTEVGCILLPGGIGPQSAGGDIREGTEWIWTLPHVIEIKNTSGQTKKIQINIQYYKH